MRRGMHNIRRWSYCPHVVEDGTMTADFFHLSSWAKMQIPHHENPPQRRLNPQLDNLDLHHCLRTGCGNDTREAEASLSSKLRNSASVRSRPYGLTNMLM